MQLKETVARRSLFFVWTIVRGCAKIKEVNVNMTIEK